MWIDHWLIQRTALTGFGSQECYGSPHNVAVGRGFLSLTVRQEAGGFTCQDPSGSFVTPYTGEMVTT